MLYIFSAGCERTVISAGPEPGGDITASNHVLRKISPELLSPVSYIRPESQMNTVAGSLNSSPFLKRNSLPTPSAKRPEEALPTEAADLSTRIPTDIGLAKPLLER